MAEACEGRPYYTNVDNHRDGGKAGDATFEDMDQVAKVIENLGL
jgi:hypothetical protein